MRKIHIGMRKIKSLISVSLSFVIWEIIRIFLPMLEAHPVFAYIYAIIEMRETPDKTKNFGKLRIKATFVGLIIGLLFVTASVFFSQFIEGQWLSVFIEFLFILIGAFCSLCVAELVGCKNFCGIAAIIAVICMVSHSGEDRYLYAVMRVLQTLIGVFSAMVVNVVIKKKESEEND